MAKRTGEVVAGNTRLKAAQSLGLETVPVVWFDGSDLEATAYSIADNRSHEFATWDEPALGKLLEQLRAEDALEGVGFAEEEIDRILAEIEAGRGSGDVDPDLVPEPSDEPTAAPCRFS